MKHLTGHRDADIAILNQMDDKTLLSFCQSNRETRDFCNNNQQFWLNRIITKYGIPIDILNKYKKDRSWSEYYVELIKTLKPAFKGLDIFRSAVSNRLDWFIAAVHLSGDINYRYHHDKHTALIIAASHGYMDGVKYLVEHGANVNLSNRWGKTPLMIVASRNNLDFVKYLVEHGADINHRSYNGKTALRQAREFRADEQLIDYLISMGATE